MKKYQQLQWVCDEASRCLFCNGAPCIESCHAHINIPQFIRLIRWNDIKGAKKVIKDNNCLGGYVHIFVLLKDYVKNIVFIVK